MQTVKLVKKSCGEHYTTPEKAHIPCSKCNIPQKPNTIRNAGWLAQLNSSRNEESK